jgi:hypothetical protein
MKTIIRSTTGEYVGMRINMPEPRDVITLNGCDFSVVAVSGNMIFTDLMTFFLE